MQQSWHTTVQDFLEELEKEKGFHSVKDVCKFLLTPYVLDQGEKPYTWKNKEEVLEYLMDYAAVSMSHYDLHSKWKHIGNMKSIAVYDKQEAEKILELHSLLANDSP